MASAINSHEKLGRGYPLRTTLVTLLLTVGISPKRRELFRVPSFVDDGDGVALTFIQRMIPNTLRSWFLIRWTDSVALYKKQLEKLILLARSLPHDDPRIPLDLLNTDQHKFRIYKLLDAILQEAVLTTWIGRKHNRNIERDWVMSRVSDMLIRYKAPPDLVAKYETVQALWSAEDSGAVTHTKAVSTRISLRKLRVTNSIARYEYLGWPKNAAYESTISVVPMARPIKKRDGSARIKNVLQNTLMPDAFEMLGESTGAEYDVDDLILAPASGSAAAATTIGRSIVDEVEDFLLPMDEDDEYDSDATEPEFRKDVSYGDLPEVFFSTSKRPRLPSL